METETAICGFLSRTDSVPEAKLLERYLGLLDDEERGRLARYRFEEDQRSFLVSHALLRVSLSRFEEVPPHSWRFERNEHGHPKIAHPPSSSLRFSLSHTRGLAACLIGQGIGVGIDVESAIRGADLLALADRFFSEEEKATLRALPENERKSGFLSLWTLKEAYAKARGLGLALPFQQIGFRIEGATLRAEFGERLADEPSRWSFFLMRPTQEHWLAAAVQSHNVPARGPEMNWLVPLVEETLTPTPLPVATSIHRAVSPSA